MNIKRIRPQLLVRGRFQELFHSPPGVLFSVRSRYSSLSVYQEYLALEGGPPAFTPGFPRLALLWILLIKLSYHYRALTCYGQPFQAVHVGSFY